MTIRLGPTRRAPTSIGAVILLSITLPLSAERVGAQVTGEASSFVEWARASLYPLAGNAVDLPFDDLEPLDALIGDARIVALGESPHAGAEPLQFRNRLARYLVERHGFSAIAIESGFVQGRIVHDYVRGEPGVIEEVARRGITWSFHEYPQNVELVRWLREYNESADSPVDFYGFDLSGAATSFATGAPQPGGTHVALDYLLAYLERTDPEAHVVFHDRLASFLPRVARDGSGAYSELSAAERNELTATIADLVNALEETETDHRAAGAVAEYLWALQVARDARESDLWLRDANDEDGAPGGVENERERAQAANVAWILDRLGPKGRVLIFASNPHVVGTFVRRGAPAEFRRPGEPLELVPHTSSGTLLRHRHGNDYVVLGNLVGGTQQIGCGSGPAIDLPPPPDSTVAGLLRGAGPPLFLLNLRDAPVELADWLGGPRQFDRNPPFLVGPVGDAFDGVVYMAQVTPACPRVARHPTPKPRD